MAEVVWTDEAIAWLAEIHDYIAADNPEAAYKTVRAIYDKAESLVHFPEIGTIYSGAPDKNVRLILHNHYGIVCRYDAGDVIEILGILHGALNLERFLPTRDE